MNIDLAKDRETTFSILNYIRAAYQGKLAGLNLLSQVSYPGFSSEELTSVQHNITKIEDWVQQLYNGECLFSASSTSLDTFDAQHAFGLLEKLKPDLSKLAEVTEKILRLQQLPSDDDVKILLSNYTRQLYARDTYIRGLIEYCKAYGDPATVNEYLQASEQSTKAIEHQQEVVRVFREGGFNIKNVEPSWLQHVHGMTISLPIIFRSLVVDISQLIAPFKGGFTFQNFDFSREESDEWQGAGFGAVQAAYWRAQMFTPLDSQGWLQAGFKDPVMANAWKAVGFEPQIAIYWAQKGFSPDYAMLWASAGYDVDKAIKEIEGGVKQPPPRQPR